MIASLTPVVDYLVRNRWPASREFILAMQSPEKHDTGEICDAISILVDEYPDIQDTFTRECARTIIFNLTSALD